MSVLADTTMPRSTVSLKFPSRAGFDGIKEGLARFPGGGRLYQYLAFSNDTFLQGYFWQLSTSSL
jgi:hypothetical protein